MWAASFGRGLSRLSGRLLLADGVVASCRSAGTAVASVDVVVVSVGGTVAAGVGPVTAFGGFDRATGAAVGGRDAGLFGSSA